MENQDILNKSVGTKELPKLEPKEVEIQGLRIDPKKKKGTEQKIGDILVLLCKHPDKEEIMEITQVKILKGDNLKVVGLWITEDEEGKLQKGSACDSLLKITGLSTLGQLEGTKVQTVVQSDNNPYLCIKGY